MKTFRQYNKRAMKLSEINESRSNVRRSYRNLSESNNSLNQIIEDVLNNELNNIGFPPIKITKNNYSGFDIIGKRFRLEPQIFLNQQLGGTVYVSEENDDGVIQVWADIKVFWESFGGGTNGSTILKVSFNVDENSRTNSINARRN